MLVLDILEQHKMDPAKDLQLINLQVSEMPTALKSGEVDACAVWTPNFNHLLKIEGTHVLVDDTQFSLFKQYGIGPGPDLVVVRRDFAEKNPNATRAFLEAYFEAVELLKAKPEECAKMLLELTNLQMADQMAVLKDIAWYGKNKQRELMKEPASFVVGMQKLAEFLERHKQIDKVPTVKDWVNVQVLP